MGGRHTVGARVPCGATGAEHAAAYRSTGAVIWASGRRHMLAPTPGREFVDIAFADGRRPRSLRWLRVVPGSRGLFIRREQNLSLAEARRQPDRRCEREGHWCSARGRDRFFANFGRIPQQDAPRSPRPAQHALPQAEAMSSGRSKIPSFGGLRTRALDSRRADLRGDEGTPKRAVPSTARVGGQTKSHAGLATWSAT